MCPLDFRHAYPFFPPSPQANFSFLRPAQRVNTHPLAFWGFPGDVVKNPPAIAGDRGDEGSIPGSGRSPGVGNGNTLQYSCLEKFHGQRSLVGYSPWGPKDNWACVCVRARFLVFTVLLVLFMCAFSVLVGSLTFGGKKTFYSNFGRNPQANWCFSQFDWVKRSYFGLEFHQNLIPLTGPFLH